MAHHGLNAAVASTYYRLQKASEECTDSNPTHRELLEDLNHHPLLGFLGVAINIFLIYQGYGTWRQYGSWSDTPGYGKCIIIFGFVGLVSLPSRVKYAARATQLRWRAWREERSIYVSGGKAQDRV